MDRDSCSGRAGAAASLVAEVFNMFVRPLLRAFLFLSHAMEPQVAKRDHVTCPA